MYLKIYIYIVMIYTKSNAWIIYYQNISLVFNIIKKIQQLSISSHGILKKNIKPEENSFRNNLATFVSVSVEKGSVVETIYHSSARAGLAHIHSTTTHW